MYFSQMSTGSSTCPSASMTLYARAMIDLLCAGTPGYRPRRCSISSIRDWRTATCRFSSPRSRFEYLTPAPVVGQRPLDPPQRPGDRVILLLEPLEPTVELVEVLERLASQLGDAPVRLGEAPVDLRELAPEELDELLILGGAHASALPHPATGFKCVRWPTPPASGAAVARHGS
jgi:hypothetical protein